MPHAGMAPIPALDFAKLQTAPEERHAWFPGFSQPSFIDGDAPGTHFYKDRVAAEQIYELGGVAGRRPMLWHYV